MQRKYQKIVTVQYLVFLLQKNLSRKMIQVSCDVLGLEESFQGICFGCACSYATIDEKIWKVLRYVFIKVAQRLFCKRAS